MILPCEKMVRLVIKHSVLLVFCLIVLGFPLHCRAGSPELRVGVASNFIGAMDELVPLFEKQSGIRVKTSYSSTGRLYGQIVNGAPFDLFLAADEVRPGLLEEKGICEEPFVYAQGIVVLFSTQSSNTADERWQEVVQKTDTGRIAIASPEIAPYGAVARQALKKSGLWHGVKKHLVYGQNVSQAFYYGVQGLADSAFTSLSLALSEYGQKGLYWAVPEADPVVQQGCRLTQAVNGRQAGQFIKFLLSPETRERIRSFGYH